MSRRSRAGASAAGASLLVGGAGSALLLSLMAGTAGATGSTFTVDTLVDGAPQPSDCTTPVAGSCSLRDAIAAAVDGDSIVFASGLTGTITLSGTELEVGAAVSIQGPGASLLTINAASQSRVFYVCSSNDPASISGVTMTGGREAKGGALYEEGCGGVILRNVVISGNDATTAGGGVFSNAELWIYDSTITGNHATSAGGGFVAKSDLVMVGTSVTTNVATNSGGGGLYAAGRTTIDRSTIADNSSGHGCGGGLYFGGGSTTLTVTNSTFSGNSTTDCYGGAIDVDGNGNDVLIANSTFVGNSAPDGGAIHIDHDNRVHIDMSTITGNSATETNPFYSGGGIHLGYSGTLTTTLELTGTVVAGNTAPAGAPADISAGNGGMRGPHSGASITATSSFIGDLGSNMSLLGTGIVRGSDPRLGALGANGGPTRTMVPISGSPLIDAGPAVVPTFTGSASDQRGAGYSRIFGSTSDIGAIEVQPPPAPSTTTTTTTTAAPGPVTPAFTG